MAGLCKCENSDCINKDKCKRFKDTIGDLMDFKFICNESNNYQWIIKIEESITETKE